MNEAAQSVCTQQTARHGSSVRLDKERGEVEWRRLRTREVKKEEED
jgi:hypothetical protein